MMDIYYVNSRGIVLDLLELPYCLQTGDFFDYDWEYESVDTSALSSRITEFTRGIRTKSAVLSVLNYSKESYYRAINKFHETVEYDVLNKTPGKLYIGEQYLLCYVVASEKTEWEYDIELLDNDITIVTEYPFWITERKREFEAIDVENVSGKKYPYSYPCRYGGGGKETYIINEHFVPVNFKLRIYGACVNPQVIIGGHIYTVYTILEDGEYLEINSIEETVIKTMLNGTLVNLFHYRGTDIFTKISPGKNDIVWPGSFDFDLITYEERSEPKWQLRR